MSLVCIVIGNTLLQIILVPLICINIVFTRKLVCSLVVECCIIEYLKQQCFIITIRRTVEPLLTEPSLDRIKSLV